MTLRRPNPEQHARMLIIFAVLVSLFERAFRATYLLQVAREERTLPGPTATT